jgi:glycerophosphoryl diester phosphodiesterase
VPADAVHVHYSAVDEDFVSRARELGRPVHAWTVDDPDMQRRLLTLGVDGIMTNNPRGLRSLVDAWGK